jgi:hypothetical protein
MVTFDVGETVICSVEVERLGVLVNPDAGYPTIQIYDEEDNPQIYVLLVPTPAAMTADAVGAFHYDFQTVAKTIGVYRARITSKVGARITILDGAFKLRE